MTSNDARRDAARLTVARMLLERFPPGPERDAWLDWLVRLGSEREAPPPGASAPGDRPASERRDGE